jgi:hypothetical protein
MAARFFINGGVNNNWNNTGNWSTTSGGTGGSAVPTSSDDVHFDNNSPACTVNIVGAALSINFTNYNNTITMTNSIGVSGNVTLGTTTPTFTGTGAIQALASGTWTSGGIVFNGNFNTSTTTTVTITFADSWTMTGTWTQSQATVYNGNTLNIKSASVLFGAAGNRGSSGTTIFNLNGTSTNWRGGAGSAISNTMTINMTGTLTLDGTSSSSAMLIGAVTVTINALGAFANTSGGLLAFNNNATLTVNVAGLTIVGINIAGATSTINGTSGIAFQTVQQANASLTFILGHGNTYTISTSVVLSGTAAAHMVLKSDSAGSQAILTLLNGATQDISFCNTTDIDSSNGLTFWDFKGTLSNTKNWNLLTAPPPTKAAKFFN